MPTWPSGTKASTANVSAGSDQISQARADIKQNIDNVNTIIDTFNISSPSNGDLLQYSTSSGKWEQVATSAVGGGKRTVFYHEPGTYYGTNTTNSFVYEWVTEVDGGAVSSVSQSTDSAGSPITINDSAGLLWHFTLSAGYYELFFAGDWPVDGGGVTIDWFLYDLETRTSSNFYTNNGSDSNYNKSFFKYYSSPTRLTVGYKQGSIAQGPQDFLFTGGQSTSWRLIVIKHS